MFREKPSAIQTAILRATDEKNTKDKWDLIMDVCDLLSSSSEESCRSAIQFLDKRLNSINSNVQLLTLTLTDAIVKNCDSKTQHEIASRLFTDSLLHIAGSPSTHNQIKSKIAVLVNEWATVLQHDPSMDLMQRTCDEIRKLDIVDLRAPKKPGKQKKNNSELKKEEDELQFALALSLSEATAQEAESQKHTEDEKNSEQPTEPKDTSLTTTSASSISRVRALYDFAASEPGELSFQKGDVILVLESVFKDWWKGSCKNKVGIFPVNYVERIVEPTSEQKEQMLKAEQLTFDALPRIDDLLNILSSAPPEAADDDELQTKYHETIILRPKLIRLIEKYASQKEELMDLNERLLGARKDYEALYEQSMLEMRRY
ncbi:ESCRT 0 complex subunit, sorting receptor for ubiquitinated membrane protein, Hse1 [Schizosaccharomyces osmophilus]|uniref:Class E vacuolar protein-sorting machinery protein HSE1 n=1 Tax=Schizosaccharomyces osmophilus TaxID=2545709 RepID=A0AAF0AVL1_9SCHI|nr:ESCRT 0 complex subunit, sorting receptor for ubiquitinated membrane protein, Hse1 [Schizosaccharomyces osmophilus]WBW72110.1 ESCRT 0 complex subunit, sorting receptor for ubiquitinated membrane protein, Hse1 [Schizosaccharomyces osmophilus]